MSKGWKSITKSVKKWHQGLGGTLQFWSPKKVFKGVHKQWSFSKLDPLGRVLDRTIFPQNSAATFSASGNPYGHSGSIVGRF